MYIYIYLYIYNKNYDKIPLKTVEKLKIVGKVDFLLTFFPVLIVQSIYIFVIMKTMCPPDTEIGS